MESRLRGNKRGNVFSHIIAVSGAILLMAAVSSFVLGLLSATGLVAISAIGDSLLLFLTGGFGLGLMFVGLWHGQYTRRFG